MDTRHPDASEADLESIKRAATDYIEAWLTGDADRMAGCLHPDLTKRAIDVNPTSGHRSVSTMTQRDMVEGTRSGRGLQLARGYEVTIHATFRNVAAVQVDSAAYVDFLQIGRFDDRWQIVNVLWEPRAER